MHLELFQLARAYPNQRLIEREKSLGSIGEAMEQASCVVILPVPPVPSVAEGSAAKDLLVLRDSARR